MKKLLFVVGLVLSSTLNAQNYQPKFYLSKLFYDSISKDGFLYEQRYADFNCKGFTITLNTPSVDPSIDLSSWVYRQNFLEYSDTTKYSIVYEGIVYDNGFHYEYFKIFDNTTNKLIRQLMASYDFNNNQLVALRDSNLSW
jgi:hypothetical protein